MSDINKKQESLASAIYLITSFFDDKEPLKWRLRMLVTDLVSVAIKDKSVVVADILSLFGIAKTANLISEPNYDILFKELSKLEQGMERPLELVFSPEPALPERTLPEPQKLEHIKDKMTEKAPLKEFGAVSVKKNSRQSIIIGILKRKKEIMIKDVSSLINGCSEKTIQRELSAMVQAGVLKKQGEKRWSRYSLARP